MSEQVPTTSVTVQWVMRSAAFAAGVDDVRNGRPPDFDNQGEGDWNYERGRQWASLAPRSMPLKIGGTLNPKAIALYNAARKRGYVR